MQYFSDIPEELLEDIELPKPMSEIEVRRRVEEIMGKNKKVLSFLGASCYNHYIPSHVKALISRSEFYTSYTPYQAEISQGMLQMLFEYQSFIAELVGMEVVNSSMYDWCTALAEAALMCQRVKEGKFLIPKIIHPERREVLKTYTASKFEIQEILHDDRGQIDLEDLKEKIGGASGVYVENPSFYGYFLENLKEIYEIAKDENAMFVCGVDPISLGLVKPPEADIIIGEGQGLGNPMNFGGPLLGIFATKLEYVRKMPGRLIGVTESVDGERGYVMTLQTREQHIRREKATSNICTNEALCAAASCIYLATLGGKLKDLGELIMRNANYVMKRINKIQDFTSPIFNSLHFKEFTVRHENLKKIHEKLLEKGIQGGYEISDDTAIYCVTEVCTKKDVDFLIESLEELK